MSLNLKIKDSYQFVKNKIQNQYKIEYNHKHDN